MISPQQLFIRWIEFSAVGVLMLVAAKIAISRLRQPADRINLIVMTFVITAAVPLLMAFIPMPHWQLGLVATEQAGANKIPSDSILPPASQSSTPLPQEASREVALVPDAIAPERMEISPSAPSLEGEGRLDYRTTAEAPSIQAATIPPTESQSIPAPWRWDPWWCATLFLVLSYGFAATLFLVETFAGRRRLQQLAKRAALADDHVAGTWREITAGRGNRVRLLVSSEITGPMAYGTLRPTVMIPESIATGDPAVLEFCLKHEWTHVEHGDLHAWGLTWVCQFFIWFQPLFWMLRRDLRVCQDFLADHRAAGDEIGRIEYSALLLAFTKERMGRPIPGVIAFFDRSSNLSRRIKMLLNSNLTLRLRSPRAFCAGAGIVLFACAALFGAVRLNTATASSSEPNSHGEETPSLPTAPQDTPSDNKNAAIKIIRGSVVDQGGKPVAKAKISLPLRHVPVRIASTTTDDAGQFELKFPSDWLDTRLTGNQWTLWAYAPGHGITSENVGKVVVQGANELTVKIALPAEVKTSFKILTPKSEPLPGALVESQHYKSPIAYEYIPEELLKLFAPRTDAQGVATFMALEPKHLMSIQIVSEAFGKQVIRVDREPLEAVRTIKLRAPGRIEGRLVGGRPEWTRGVKISFSTDNRDEWSDSSGNAQVVTDNEGRFVVPIIACGGPVHTYVGIDSAHPVLPRLEEDLYLKEGETLRMEIPLVPTRLVQGTILTKSNGKPVPKAEISLGFGSFRQSAHAVTDAKGRYQARVLPGPVRLQIISMPGDFAQLGTPWASPVQVPEGVNMFDLPKIEVVSTHDLSGSLVGEKNEPLAGMQVMASDQNRRHGFGKTDAKGQFTMKVPDGVETTFEVYLEKEGGVAATVVQKDPLILRYVADKREQKFEAERAAKADVTLTGRILSDGKPLAGVTLNLSRGVPVFSSLVKSSNSRPAYYDSSRIVPVGKAESDADGRYRLTGLKAGDQYSIEIKPPFPAADPTWTYQSPYSPRLSDTIKGDFALPDLNLRKLNQSLAGIVVDPAGKPVVGAQISVQLQKGGASVGRISSSGPPPWTTTDNQGKFKLQQLPDEPLAIFAYIRTSDKGGPIRFPAKVPAGKNQQNIRVVLDPSLVEEEK